MCSIRGIVSVPAGRRGSGSEPGCRRFVAVFRLDRRQAAAGAATADKAPEKAPEKALARRSVRLLIPRLRRLVLCHAGEFRRIPGRLQEAVSERLPNGRK
jgi:hypothetical protein